MLGIFLTIVHIAVAVFLIVVVLLQTGKRADLAGAFGGGGSQTAFGTRGAATLLSKATTASAVIFMVTSLALSLLASRAANETGGSVLPEDRPPAQTQQVPQPQPESQPPVVPLESTPLDEPAADEELPPSGESEAVSEEGDDSGGQD